MRTRFLLVLTGSTYLNVWFWIIRMICLVSNGSSPIGFAWVPLTMGHGCDNLPWDYPYMILGLTLTDDNYLLA